MTESNDEIVLVPEICEAAKAGRKEFYQAMKIHCEEYRKLDDEVRLLKMRRKVCTKKCYKVSEEISSPKHKHAEILHSLGVSNDKRVAALDRLHKEYEKFRDIANDSFDQIIELMKLKGELAGIYSELLPELFTSQQYFSNFDQIKPMVLRLVDGKCRSKGDLAVKIITQYLKHDKNTGGSAFDAAREIRDHFSDELGEVSPKYDNIFESL